MAGLLEPMELDGAPGFAAGVQGGAVQLREEQWDDKLDTFVWTYTAKTINARAFSKITRTCITRFYLEKPSGVALR